MDVDEKIQFVQSTLMPMASHTFPFIASVIGISGNGSSGTHVGSALRATISGRRCLITAAHVVEQARQHYGRIAVSAIRGVPPYEIPNTPGRVDEERDIAAYFLSDDYPADEICFWPYERMDRGVAELSTDFLFVHGFPAVHSGFSARLGGLVNKSLPYGVMRRDEDLPDDIRAFQFAMDFDPINFREPDGKPSEWLDPRGLSGSPVFRIGASGRRVDEWRVDHSLLVGIVTQWRPDERILVATLCQSVLDLLEAI